MDKSVPVQLWKFYTSTVVSFLNGFYKTRYHWKDLVIV